MDAIYQTAISLEFYMQVCYADNGRIGTNMDNKKPLLPVKSDFVFRLIFGDQRNVDILVGYKT